MPRWLDDSSVRVNLEKKINENKPRQTLALYSGRRERVTKISVEPCDQPINVTR